MARKKPMPKQARLLELLKYDPRSGLLIWINCPSSGYTGRQAGRPNNGYYRLAVDGRSIYAHMAIWIMVHGDHDLPKEIDHKEGDGFNNRIWNLRQSSRVVSGFNTKKRSNNTSGYKGVSWDKRKGFWQAKIRRAHIGYFSDILSAVAAYDAAAIKTFGEYACVNFPKIGRAA